MKKFILKMANGQKSAICMTKEQALKAVNNWITKQSSWIHITVRDIINDKIDVIFESESKTKISNLNLR